MTKKYGNVVGNINKIYKKNNDIIIKILYYSPHYNNYKKTSHLHTRTNIALIRNHSNTPKYPQKRSNRTSGHKLNSEPKFKTVVTSI